MPLAEVVILKVGSAIAKSIFQLWLKDMPVVSTAASSILDMLELRTSDKIAQQKARRQFEAIGEKVGENLLLLFEAEGAHLDEGSQTAVAFAVEETFQRASISSRLLAKNNLEPQRLAAYVLTTHPTAVDSFNETEKSFYHRIIKEACEYIVDIASQLPQYSERNFAEILKREDQLLSIAATVLQELRQMRERLNLTVEAERFELEYRRAIARDLDVLQLFGTDVSTANRRHRLSVAYVTLSVKQTSLSMIDSREHAARKQGRAEIAGDVVTSVDKALVSSRCLLIRGFAGSGKTTLLQWIAVQSASRSFEGELSDWNTTLPFYIRLRQFAKLELPSPEMFPGLIAPAIADTMPKGWVHTELKSNRAIVLVDGLDEVPASQREKVRTWLRELVTTYRGTRFIITSRPHAVEEGWMDSREFSDAELQPMDIPDIHAFIDHWHNAVREELQEETEKAELPFLAQHLKETVKYNHSIRNLATNPLLCAMLCALNRDRRKQLPADRIELYDACCYLLLERRDKERHMNSPTIPVSHTGRSASFLKTLPTG